MARVRSSNTGPEVHVRKILYCLGYRFRLHRRDLPGTPDIVLPAYRSVIFVHGCFWHRHQGCRDATTPKTRKGFWDAKFKENVVRDRKNISALHELGWRVLIVWECEVHRQQSLARKLSNFLEYEKRD